jgi:hypothetical protein
MIRLCGSGLLGLTHPQAETLDRLCRKILLSALLRDGRAAEGKWACLSGICQPPRRACRLERSPGRMIVRPHGSQPSISGGRADAACAMRYGPRVSTRECALRSLRLPLRCCVDGRLGLNRCAMKDLEINAWLLQRCVICQDNRYAFGRCIELPSRDLLLTVG